MGKWGYFVLVIAILVAFMLGAFLFPIKGDDPTSILNSKECNWENIYQGLFGSASVYRDISAGSILRKGGFVVPLDIDYKEVKFEKLGVLASSTARNARFMLNGIDCGTLDQDIFVLHDFSETCVSALKEGLNSFNSSDNIIVHEIYVGMKYKPSNCA